MKFVKSNLKLFVGIIVGAVISGIGVYAITSNSIGFQPQDNGWNVSTVDSALNSLYDNISTTGKVNLSRFSNHNDSVHYGLSSANNYLETEGVWKINASTLNHNFNASDDFEISVLAAVDNTQAGYMGGFKVSFMNSNNNLIDIMYRDGMGNSVYGDELVEFNGNTLYSVTALTDLDINSRYALVRRGNTISVYKDNTLLTSTEYTENLNIDEVRVTFYKYGTYTTPRSIIKEIYLGDIKNYDN